MLIGCFDIWRAKAIQLLPQKAKIINELGSSLGCLSTEGTAKDFGAEARVVLRDPAISQERARLGSWPWSFLVVKSHSGTGEPQIWRPETNMRDLLCSAITCHETGSRQFCISVPRTVPHTQLAANRCDWVNNSVSTDLRSRQIWISVQPLSSLII